MPADYSSAAAALALSPSPEPSPSSPSSSSQPPPPWIHPRRPSHSGGPSASSRRRLSAPYRSQSASSRNKSLARRAWDAANEYGERFRALWLRMTLAQRLLFVAAAAGGWAVLILMLVYSERMWAALGPLAKTWRESRAGWLAVWLATFAAAFPPLIGYSTACTVAGFVFGFPGGWPIAATATVAGSAAAFAASRGVLSGYVHRLVGADKRFVALGQVLRRDGLLVLTGVRFCPLPYSLSNGFLATIPSISVWSFSLATALASPKLLAHVFIGSRLAIIAEEGDTMTAGAKAVNYLSAMAGGLVGMTVAVFVYRRTMARAAELAREEAEEIAADGEVRGGGDDDDEAGEDSGLMMDPDEADAAALMVDADDISLWETEGVYRDEEEAVGGKGGGDRR